MENINVVKKGKYSANSTWLVKNCGKMSIGVLWCNKEFSLRGPTTEQPRYHLLWCFIYLALSNDRGQISLSLLIFSERQKVKTYKIKIASFLVLFSFFIVNFKDPQNNENTSTKLKFDLFHVIPSVKYLICPTRLVKFSSYWYFY